ncbi:hypothetical protein QJS04_geneDACA019713 [Acorus gramineus]|uniref:BTB domain-containing protein n=1 Tax=Acorus gramineus TaxID=55184 RepID=A0AAV9BS73_ACOGR|nr:hypothetical protein QJS04_geneDACA019713 [Acorus gramineus]
MAVSAPNPSQPPDPNNITISTSTTTSDRSACEVRVMNCNIASLCDHILIEGFNNGAFSDVVVQASGGSTYRLHRLILSRSPYFRNMLHGPWKEAGAPTVMLYIDDDNVNAEAIEAALAYLYGHHPKLNDGNAFRVLAAASFFDLQVFAESQDYGIHGERVRNACWGYLCQSGTMELREVLPKLSSQTLHALLTSDELWVPSEEKRFELALYALLAKSADHPEQASLSPDMGMSSPSDPSILKGKNLMDDYSGKNPMEAEYVRVSLHDNLEGQKTARNILIELADCVVDFHSDVPCSKVLQVQQETCTQPKLETRYSAKAGQPASSKNPFSDADSCITSCSYVELQNNVEANRMGGSGAAMEGPTVESTCFDLNRNVWFSRDESKQDSSVTPSGGLTPNDWVRCTIPHSWGGRIVGKRKIQSLKGNSGILGEEYDTFMNIFEGGSLLYCNMSFEALLNVRKQLEELGFPCKAVTDGLWLQTLLCHRVQEIGADTCKNCCLTSIACACRQPYVFSHGGPPSGYYRHEQDRSNVAGNMGNVYLADGQGEVSGLYGPVRVHVRGPNDGLAGIGRGTTFAPGSAWPPTRFVFSRVPCGFGNRNGQQSLANDESEARIDINGDISGDGLTALVGLSQGNAVSSIHTEQTNRVHEPDLQNRLGGSASSSSGIPMQMLETQEHALGLEWEGADSSLISLDMKTPLRHFPPFRFGVEFQDVLRLADGQVKHSPEVFYAGSLWKVSVQAFNDEDPQGRRTLGLFLHRRKAEPSLDSLRKVHMYLDSREKVTARYQTGTLLPKAPKGWGWRTALLFDELPDLLQGEALRVAAVVQLV